MRCHCQLRQNIRPREQVCTPNLVRLFLLTRSFPGPLLTSSSPRTLTLRMTGNPSACPSPGLRMVRLCLRVSPTTSCASGRSPHKGVSFRCCSAENTKPCVALCVNTSSLCADRVVHSFLRYCLSASMLRTKRRGRIWYRSVVI